MSKPKVTEFAFNCYPVTDMARARKFYEGALNLKSTPICRKAMISDPDGNTICIHKRNGK